MTTDPDFNDHEPEHAASATSTLLDELPLYGHRPFDDEPDLATYGIAVAPERQIAAATAAVPGAALRSIEVRQSWNDAVRVTLAQGGETYRVLVHPSNAQVLAIQAQSQRFMQIVRDIHGELLLGDRGSLLVELAASWAIVMILTGLFLWWPRSARGVAGVLYPKLSARGRIMWRDLHAVTGFWISFFALALMITGLPWTTVWGDGFKRVREATGTAAEQDWSTRRRAPDEHAGHRGEHGLEHLPSVATLAPMIATVRALDLPPPVLLSPPNRGETLWTARSDTPNRPLRVTLKLDPQTGRFMARQGFSDRHPIDRAVGYGIAAHEGQLFGLANQLLGLMTAVGLVTLALSGVVLWWRRRPEGRLGAPRPPSDARLGFVLAATIAVAACLLPLLGLSLLTVASLERAMLTFAPRVSEWIGLRRPTVV